MFAHHLRRCLTQRLMRLQVGKMARTVTGYRQETVDVTQEVKIKELISKLKIDERQLLYHHLRLALLKEQWQSQVDGGSHQQPSASSPSSPKRLFASWLHRGSAYVKTYIEKPSRSQLVNLFVYHSLPYIAFGFMDNCTMILAGEYIEAYLGRSIGLSTMAAAGLGNILADALSISLAYQVEHFITSRMQGPASITLSQFELTQTRFVIQLARICGIVLGCLLGMMPLLFK